MPERALAAAHDAAAAVVFLTRVPLPWHVPDADTRLARAAPWFPLVGAVVGGLGALGWWAGAALASPLVGAVAAVAVTIVATGALHEDGLADTFDGLGGSPGRERALAIMRDSRLGSYGALALVLVVLGRVAALTSLGAQAPLALVGGHALARLASLPLIRWLPYARAGEGGSGTPFPAGVGTAGLAAAAVFTALLTLLLWGAGAIAAWLAAAAVLGLAAAWFRRRLGGITGDTLGAAIQLVELTAYLALLAGA